MSNLRSLTLCVMACALLCASAATAQKITPAVRIVNQIDESQLVPLKGAVHPLANAINDRGAAPVSLQLDRMHLVLTRSASQETALRQLITEMHSPGSANYHKWLTPAQFGAQFGPSDQDIATVTTWLTNHGFSVAGVNPGRQTIEFSGNAAQLRSAFHTQIHKYLVNGETHFANATDPQIPAALAPVVGGFVSLNNFRLKNYNHYLGKAAYDPSTGTATPQWTIGGGTSTTDRFVLAPQDFYVQYDLSPLYTAGTNGTGQTIAIINDSNINVAVANQFRTLFGLSANPPQVIIDGNDPGIDGINNPDGPNGDSSEAYIDVEWSGAVAPNATIDLVIAANTALENGLVLAAEHAVYGNIAPVISVSFGNCEAGLGSTNGFLNYLWEQAAAQGITVLVSSGDAGSATCDNDNSQYYAVNGQAVNGFASTPFNVAVGGTDFYYSDYATGGASVANYWNTTASNSTPAVSIKGVIPEQPWNDSQFGDNIRSMYSISGGLATSMAGGGGGSSAVYAKPAWQTGFGDAVRDLPDVSLFAANGLNYSYYPVCWADGDCQPATSGNTVQISGFGGTSVSSPAFAGIMALVNQKYGRQGQADTVLYPLSKQYAQAFHDVTVGSNSEPCAFSPISTDCIAAPTALAYTITDPYYGPATEGQIGAGATPEYNAAVGYDEASGLGTVDANVLVTHWNNVTFTSTSTSLTMTPSTTTFTHGTALTFSGTVTGTGTPTGDVALMTDSTEPINQGQTFFTLSGGSYTSTTAYPLPNGVDILPGGTYNIWAHYGGDANNAPSNSAKTQITVNKEASTAYFNVMDVSGNAAINSGATNILYGQQLILDAQVLPTTYYTLCVNTSNPSNTCNSLNYSYPTGTVTFADSGTPINTAVINAEGDAEFNAPWGVGSHSVTANYSGDQSYTASSGAPVSPFTFTIAADTPDILLNSPIENSSGYGLGQPTVFTVGVENSLIPAEENYYKFGLFSVPVKAPTGSVSVSGLPGASTAAVTLVAAVDPTTNAPEGVATFTVPTSAAAGAYSVTVTYTTGDGNYASRTVSGTVTITAPSGIASTTTASYTGSISPTTNISVTGTVTGQGTKAPTGTVLFYSSGFILGSVGLVPGSTGDVSTFTDTLNSQNLFQGANLITVQYSGDTTYAPSSATLTPIASPLSDFTLTPNTTIVQVNAGSSATDTINLASMNGFSGAVTFTCTAATGITCSVTPSATLASAGSATATLTVSTPVTTAIGNYNVSITGTSGAFVHTLALTAAVNAAPFYPTTTTTTLSVTPGATTSNTAPITITPGVGGFSGAVTLACSISPVAANDPATCSLNPASVQLSGTTAQPSTLTVNTTAAVALNHPMNLFWPSTGGAVLAVAFFFGIPRRRRNWLAMLGLLVLFVSGAAIGCGGGGGGGTVSNGNPGTSAGNYTVTVTATSGSNIETTTFTLTVI